MDCSSRSRTARSSGAMSLDQWNAVIGVNLTGVFLCGREAAKHMIELGNGGVIVNISSISRVGNAGQSNYSAAKAGVESMAVVWAKELARYGIRAASVAPGFTRTEILSSMRPEVLNKLTAPVPLKRLGLPRKSRTPCASFSRTTSSPAAVSRSMGACVSSSRRLARAPRTSQIRPRRREHARQGRCEQAVGRAIPARRGGIVSRAG